ncbi:MAG: mercuric reductase [Hymenobacteraceae bacterium]|nr:mercuric reductase [Hymenobacteraceae bacterium]
MVKEQSEHYDAIIIGTGQGGTPLAKKLAKEGWKVAIIEASAVGGSCVNYGCTPTKALLASAHTAQLARNAQKYGVYVQETQVKMPEVKQRRDELVKQSREKNVRALEESKADLIKGKASFLDQKKLLVSTEEGTTYTFTADKIFINTGAVPVMPDLEGLQSINYFTYKSIQNLTELPEHLLILGGGYIGLEFGQMFRRFGSKVTILEEGDQLLDREDSDVAEEMKKILEDEGIEILLKRKPLKVERQSEGLRLYIEGRQEPLRCTHLLIATGVKANTEDLALENAGIETDEQGNIKTDDHLATNIAGIYAIGDVKGGPQFTHISFDDYRILRDSLLYNKSRSIQDRLVPYCVFTDPQLGRVGLTELQAREKGIRYKVAKLKMASVARGKETGHTKGFMKVLVNEEDEQIIGAAILAAEGGEIMSAIQIAMMGKLSYKELKEGVFAHPTYVESLNNLFSKMEREGS